MRPTKDLLTALDRLRNAREMQIFRQWLAATANEHMVRAIQETENVDVHRGRAQALMELVAMIEGAPQALSRLENRNGTPQQSQPGNPQSRH